MRSYANVLRAPHMLALLGLALVHGGGLLGLVALGSARAPDAALVAVSVVTGVTIPPVSSVLRAIYPRLLGGDPALVRGAYALDSVLTEMIFLVGPLLTAAAVVVLDASAALVVSAACVMAGTVTFLMALPSASGELDVEAPSPGRLGALRAPGIQTLVLSMLPVGFGFGAIEIAIAAFARDQGRPALAGVLVGIWALGSIGGGLVYGARSHGASLARVHVSVAMLLPLGFLALALSGPTWSMGLLVIPAGVLIAPLIASRNELAGVVALPGSRTEAFTWPLTALVGGSAVGTAVAGAIVEAGGWRTTVVVAAAAAALGGCVSLTRRATLRPAPSGA